MAEYSQKWHNGTSSRTKGPHYTKDCPQKEEGKTLKEAYYTQFGTPYQPGGQYRATRPGFYQRNNGNSLYLDRRASLEESLTKFMAESAKRHSNIIKEIRASTDAAIRNQGASIKTLELQIEQMSKVLQERGFRSLPSATETNPRDQVKAISTARADFSEIHGIEHKPYAARRSVSSSSSHHQGTSSHQHDDDDDDVETSRASTPSPTTYLNSLNLLDYQNYQMPSTSKQTDETLFARQTTLLNQTQQMHEEMRGGFKSFRKALKGVFSKKKK
ncbi:hypothetical protein Tco_1118844 [Tanacetum coccineum]